MSYRILDVNTYEGVTDVDKLNISKPAHELLLIDDHGHVYTAEVLRWIADAKRKETNNV